MRRILLFCLITAIGGCAASHPATSQPSLPIDAKASESFFTSPGPGLTLLARVAGGYELLNGLYRIVVSDQTGDVIFWSMVGNPRNSVYQHGIYAALTGLPYATPHGYIEKRDDQTWQYYGQDDNHIGWQKIYSLQGDSLRVTLVIQNNRPDALITAIQINGDLPSLRIGHHDPEQFTAAGGYGTVRLRGFNEFHNSTSQPALPTLIQSDTFHLNSGQRQSYTSEWMLSQ